jgi:hypothetical protein
MLLSNLHLLDLLFILSIGSLIGSLLQLPIVISGLAWLITEGAQKASGWFNAKTGFVKALVAAVLVVGANLLSMATGHPIPGDFSGWTNEVGTWIAEWLATQGGHLLKTKVTA